MDFNEIKKRRKFPIADAKNPLMGLDGVICKDPVYWCRLHEVWLSEEDVKKKKCLSKPTYDMISTYRCNCLVKKTPPCKEE